MQEINISLDAADEGSFFKMTQRAKFREVAGGIDAAIAAGLTVKINSVLMKNKNDDQILPLLKFSWERKLAIRFLEVMAMGHLHNKTDEYLFTQADILRVITEQYVIKPQPRTNNATANYWTTKEGIFWYYREPQHAFLWRL